MSVLFLVSPPVSSLALPYSGIYWLKYPGLALSFPIPSSHRALYASTEELPLELPDGTTPVVSMIRLHHPSCDPFVYQLPGGIRPMEQIT